GGQLAQGAVKLVEEVEKGDEIPDAQASAADDEIASVSPDDQDARRRDKFEKREEDAAKAGGVDKPFEDLIRAAVKTPDLSFFLDEGLDHLDARDRVGQNRVHQRAADPNAPVNSADAAGEAARPDDEEGHGKHRDQRELPVVEKEDDADADQCDPVKDHPLCAFDNETLNLLRVAGGPGHDRACADAVVKLHAEVLQVMEDLGAEVPHDPLAQPRHDVVAKACDHRPGEEGSGEQSDEELEPANVPGDERFVDQPAGKVRLHHLERPSQKEQGHREGYLLPVRLRVAKDPADQPRLLQAAGADRAFKRAAAVGAAGARLAFEGLAVA